MIYKQTSPNHQWIFYINLFSFCIEILSTSTIHCETTINPIELLRPHSFYSSILEIESNNFRTKIDDFCILSIRIEHLIVSITLTTENIDDGSEDQASLKTYINLESKTFRREYNFICSVRYCNINYLRTILITGELNWLLHLTDYSYILLSLQSLLYREKDKQNASFRCYVDGKKPILCENGTCEARYSNLTDEYEKFCRTKFHFISERYFIDIITWAKPNFYETKVRTLQYMCNVNLCNGWEIVEQVLTLLNVENDTLNLFWPSKDSFKFTTTTTQRSTSTSITKPFILSTECLTNLSFLSTNHTTNRNTIMTTNILQTSDNKLESESSITNSDLSFISPIYTSTKKKIFNNTCHLEMANMYIYYLLILYFIM
ncbi:unnamed protein product [Adineta ricciae]|uniref:Uncharacterized protein n=1 Tax=Adineta ricciae TaxID=249248 RepID=A0A815WNR1_ADIRI|nr:unnamed protein product [Adineta ricciae]